MHDAADHDRAGRRWASDDVCVGWRCRPEPRTTPGTPSTLTATSVGEPGSHRHASFTTIAVASTTLLVDNDDNAPDVASFYKAAMGAASFGYWDLAADPDLPLSYLKAHTNVVWFTGAPTRPPSPRTSRSSPRSSTVAAGC